MQGISGKWEDDNQQFHDAILKEGAIPVELVGAIFDETENGYDGKAKWCFYGGLPE